jgi:hypothetical protein
MGYEDTWQTESEGYSPDKFYTRATDGKGHSEVVHLKLPPEITSVMAQIVQSRAIPDYRTAQDIIRDAIVHRLQYLRESGMVDGVTGTVAGFEEAAREVFDFYERMQAFKEIIDRAEKLVADVGRDSEEARRAVRKVYEAALAIVDSEYWRNRYLQEIEKRFGDLLKE